MMPSLEFSMGLFMHQQKRQQAERLLKTKRMQMTLERKGDHLNASNSVETTVFRNDHCV